MIACRDSWVTIWFMKEDKQSVGPSTGAFTGGFISHLSTRSTMIEKLDLKSLNEDLHRNLH
jgi:hypothetical protein